ncbi:acyltransferase, putative [Macrophomina phaseolina MS6]|uniref:Acyltransferase, putative n=1 Tax=Macrophomina phaseolina (strain MS6) TaxID=1126212 RepID=K2RHM7_MACPH|nr:acyltransferase, putative [Macrophomina phaseolina MS6]
MPPKKRAKPSTTSAVTPHASTPSKTPTKDLPPASFSHTSAPAATDILNDPWTDDQETSLFKNLIRWKPTGVHKHMHMIQIASSMSREGFSYQMVPMPGSGGLALQNHHHHTRIPGIWKKLGELYDLEALDERENAHALAGWPDVADRVVFFTPKGKRGRRGRGRVEGGGADDDEDVKMGEAGADEDDEERDEEGEAGEEGPWFQLPDDEFGQMMWDRRIAVPGSAMAAAAAGGGGTPAAENTGTTDDGEGSERSVRGRRKPSPRVIVGRSDTDPNAHMSKRSESPPACPELLPRFGDPAPVPLEQQVDTDQPDTDDARSHAGSHAGSPAGGSRNKGAGGNAKGVHWPEDKIPAARLCLQQNIDEKTISFGDGSDASDVRNLLRRELKKIAEVQYQIIPTM